MRRSLLPFLCLAALSTRAGADVVGLSLGADYWNYDISGSARYKSTSSSDDLDLQDDLGYNDASTTVIRATLEHPVPVLPNVRLTYTDLDESADGRLTKSVVYGNTTFQLNEAVHSRFELKQTDITFYYRVLDNLVNLDLGLTAKYIDSRARITGETSGSEQANLSAWVPLVYAHAGIDLPLSGLSIGTEGSAIGYSGSRFYDFTANLNYQTPWLLGLVVGYRATRLELDDIDDSFADVKFSGPYAGAYLHF